MHISIDGGSLCSNRQFGTYTFADNLLRALQLYGREHSYDVYTYRPIENKSYFDSIIRQRVLWPKFGWMKLRVSIEEARQKPDIFLALNQALPLFTPATKVVFSQGLSFLQFPQLYKEDYSRLYRQLVDYTNRADLIITSSVKVQNELIQYRPSIAKKIVTLPFGVPLAFESMEKKSRRPFILSVSMNHPIKNISVLIRSFRALHRQKKFSQYQLILCGPFSEYGDKHITVIPQPSVSQLKELYQTANLYVSTSLYESFNFPVLEALSQECPVLAMESAIIPEMREFVCLAKNEAVFDRELQRLLLNPRAMINRQVIYEIFSWKRYVKSLISQVKQLL